MADDIESQMSAATRYRDQRRLGRLARLYLSGLEKHDAREQANRLRNVALDYVYHFRIHGNTAVLHKARKYARAAYDVYRSEADTFARVKLLDTLANISYLQGRNENEPSMLAEGEELFRAALELLDPTVDTAAWCTVANSLASVHAVRHRRDGDPAHRQAAQATYIAVRRVAARNKLSQIWLDAAGNVLRMSRDSALGAGDYRSLLRVIRNLQRIRRLEGRQEALRWTDFRHLLANALCDAARIRYDRAFADEALQLLGQNLAGIIPTEARAEWAGLTFDLAGVHLLIGEHDLDVKSLIEARDLIYAIADLPSQKRRGKARQAPWSSKSTVELYTRALILICTIRIRLAAWNRTLAPLRENEYDIAELIERQTFEDRALQAEVQEARAANGLQLALATRDGVRLREAENHSRGAVSAYLSVGQTASAAKVLITLGECLLEWASPPDPLPWWRQAIGVAEEARFLLVGGEETSEASVAAWRLALESRLRAIGWNNDIEAARAMHREIEVFIARAGARLSRAQNQAVRWLEANAYSVIARIEQTRDGFEKLNRLLSAIGEGPDASGAQRLSTAIAMGQSALAVGHVDKAITTWTEAQKELWKQIVQLGDPSLASIAICRPGESGRQLGVGAGISLADELAAALLRRAGAGDEIAALEAIERGRAVRASLARARDDREIADLRAEARRIDALAGTESRGFADTFLFTNREGGPASTLSSRARRISELASAREHVQMALTERFGSLGGAPPAVDLEAIVSALPSNAVFCVIVLAENDAHAMLIGRPGGGCAQIRSLHLPALNRRNSAELLLGGARLSGGLVGAIANLQKLGDRPAEATFVATVSDFSAELERCRDFIVPAVIDPVITGLEREFGGHIGRLCWAPPVAMWALPLHAFRPTVSSKPLVQSYCRSIVEIGNLALKADNTGRPIRRAVAIDDPRGDMLRPFPFLRTQRNLNWIKVKRPTARNVLRALEKADLFFFHGHGIWEFGDRERSGFLVAKSGPTDQRAILPFSDLRGLKERARQLAVLSACDLGAVELFLGANEFEGMPTELLEAGFACVVAASWPVHQEATAELMADFSEHMFVHGLDPVAALATAQNAGSRFTGSGAMQRARDEPGAEVASMRGGSGSLDPDSLFWRAAFRAVGL